MGAAAVAGAAGGAMAAPFRHGEYKDQMTGANQGKYSIIKSDNSSAYLHISWPGTTYSGFIITIPRTIINLRVSGTGGRIKIGGKVEDIQLNRMSDGDPYSAGVSDAAIARKILTTPGELLVEVPIYREGNQIYKFTVEPDLITKSIPGYHMIGGSGNTQQATGPSASYAGRVRAKLKPNIVFRSDTLDQISGNPVAEVEVKASADGSITERKLIKSSGVKAWDDAVLRAIDKTETLPRDVDGRVPSPLVLSFRPRD